MELKQKPEIFHCYNGSGGSSRGVDGVYGEKTWPFLRNKYVFVTESVGNRFHERIAGNDRLGLGSSKIEVLAKNPKKNQGKSTIFVGFPRLWGRIPN